MSEAKLELLQKALETHEKIFPCGGTSTLQDCFTTAGNKLYFWFNTEDDSTHLLFHTLRKEDAE
ncbi:MAG: hypothetical protein EHM32_01660 [Spirochaetales bacterium]|nr:MAG: hypothetical protein EHM32_01660 [Spirochaetales bacterium]